MALLYVAGGVVVAVVAFKAYLKYTTRTYTIDQDLSDKTILITGASAGLGKETARELARNGATVHMLCRNQAKADQAAEEIKTETKNDRVRVWLLDTSKLKSVREFAEKFLASGLPIDILINNAGIMATGDRQLTEDGLELTTATNHFGHFLLTNLLLDRIKERPKARIVNVSSSLHANATSFDPNGYNFETGYTGGMAVYSYSKLANVLFTRQLAKRLQGTGVTTNSLHPGVVSTELGRNMRAPMKYIFKPVRFFLKDANEGAQTSLYVALAPELENVSGEYFSDCAVAKINPLGLDDKLAQELWEVSEKVTGLEG